MPEDFENFREEKILVIDRRSRTIGARLFLESFSQILAGKQINIYFIFPKQFSALKHKYLKN